MRKNKVLIILLLLLWHCKWSDSQIFPTCQTSDNLAIKSKILNKDVHFAIYLPPDYNNSNRSYPVVYLLHGYTDNQTGWVQFGEINMAADKAIAERRIPPMIIVMPDAETSWYINDYKRTFYEDMFFQEFIPYIESNYRIRAKKEFRGVCGLSMGGYGSFMYALKHPDMFVAAAPLSAAVFTTDDFISMPDERYNSVFAKIFGEGLKSEARITDFWKKNNVMELMRNMPEDQKKAVKYYIDCGDDDFLSKGNSLLHILMLDNKIPHEFRVRDGVHNWTYWRTGIIDALDFIGQNFRR
jgi:enterochelin esterase-like enzyme